MILLQYTFALGIGALFLYEGYVGLLRFFSITNASEVQFQVVAAALAAVAMTSAVVPMVVVSVMMVSMMMAAMLLQLPLRQQTGGLLPTRPSWVLSVLSIELHKDKLGMTNQTS